MIEKEKRGSGRRNREVGLQNSNLGFGGVAGWVGVPGSNPQKWAQAQETVA